jgi:hypothetical protein
MLSSELAGQIAVVGRECGQCSLCCKLLKVVELDKPENVWCKHCRPGHGGCSIHPTRPQICRDYYCGWMLSKTVGDEWYPLRSHMVLSLVKINGVQTVNVVVDTSRPLIWLEPPYYGQLKSMATRGLKVNRQEDIHLVQVRSAGRVWLVLPNRDMEITSCSYVIKMTGHGEWDVEQFATAEEASSRVKELATSVAGQRGRG